MNEWMNDRHKQIDMNLWILLMKKICTFTVLHIHTTFIPSASDSQEQWEIVCLYSYDLIVCGKLIYDIINCPLKSLYQKDFWL